MKKARQIVNGIKTLFLVWGMVLGTLVGTAQPLSYTNCYVLPNFQEDLQVPWLKKHLETGVFEFDTWLILRQAESPLANTQEGYEAFLKALRGNDKLLKFFAEDVKRVRAWGLLHSLGDIRTSDHDVLESVLTYLEETNISKADFESLYHAEPDKAVFFRRCKLVDNIDFLKPFALHDAFRVDKPRVLSLGEGNFSFSASISDDISEVNRANFLATEYRTYDQLASASNIDQANLDDALGFLSSNGVEFRFGIDGTNLPNDMGNFDVVIFNFPFVDNPPISIASTQNMLRGVVAQMETRLNPGGKLFITQKEYWANQLNLSSIADNSSTIQLIGDKTWRVQDFPSYNHVITNPDNTASANVTSGITFVFSKQ